MCQVGRSWWLAEWANQGSESQESGASSNSGRYLTTYLTLAFAGVAAEVRALHRCCTDTATSSQV